MKTDNVRLMHDRKLAKRILAGDEIAIKAFMDEYFPRLYRYAHRYLGNAADTDDVVQITLAQAARRLETYRGEASLLTWLIKICRHEIYRLVKKSKLRDELTTPFLNDDVLFAAVEAITALDQDEPDQQLQRSQLIGMIQTALDQLPEHYASALELKYIDGFSTKEIALKMDTTDEAMQSILARARSAFRGICSATLGHLMTTEQHQHRK